VKRREFITLIGGAAAWPLTVRAQQGAVPVIGFLDSRTPEAITDRLRGFRQGLKEVGLLEGENVTIVYRYAEYQLERLPGLAVDLVRRQVSAIVTGGVPATFAAKAATATTPNVFVIGDDPVRLGLVTSLPRPESNLTGVNILNAELATKRLEFLRALVPTATRISVLVNQAEQNQLSELQAAALAMGLKLHVINVDTVGEIYDVFERLERERPDGLFVSAAPFLSGRRVQLAQLAAFHRLPATFTLREYAEVGGLMSYGANVVDAYRQVGVYTGRILKGAKPADLPIVQSSKFELVINSGTARMLGLTVPASLLAIADEVIE
jgi:putative tryptophan/tyrosine transport system substrate-binding protein